MHGDYSFLPRDDISFHIPRSCLTLSLFLCHLTNVTAQAHQSPSALKHGDQEGQGPRAQWVTHGTKHLMNSMPSIALLATESLVGGSGSPSHTSSLRFSFSAASQLHSPFLPVSSSSPWRPVTSVSLSFRPFSWSWTCGLAHIRLMGRREISSFVCLARHQPVRWDCHNSTSKSFRAWFTHTINHSQSCKWQHQDLLPVNKTQPCWAKLNFCAKYVRALRDCSEAGAEQSECNDCAQGWAEQEGPAAGSCAPATTETLKGGWKPELPPSGPNINTTSPLAP